MFSRPSSSFGAMTGSVIWLVPIALVASGAVIAISRHRGAERGSIIDRLVMIWLVASLSAVAILTLQPLSGGFGAPRPSSFNPISHIGRRDALDNVMLFLPVGFFAAIWWRSKPWPVAWATGLAASVSFTIELAQLILPIHRAASIHDVLSNTLGGFIGALAGLVVVRMARRSEPLPTGGHDRGDVQASLRRP
jgi:VanZ family protein